MATGDGMKVEARLAFGGRVAGTRSGGVFALT